MEFFFRTKWLISCAVTTFLAFPIGELEASDAMYGPSSQDVNDPVKIVDTLLEKARKYDEIMATFNNRASGGVGPAMEKSPDMNPLPSQRQNQRIGQQTSRPFAGSSGMPLNHQEELEYRKSNLRKAPPSPPPLEDFESWKQKKKTTQQSAQRTTPRKRFVPKESSIPMDEEGRPLSFEKQLDRGRSGLRRVETRQSPKLQVEEGWEPSWKKKTQATGVQTPTASPPMPQNRKSNWRQNQGGGTGNEAPSSPLHEDDLAPTSFSSLPQENDQDPSEFSQSPPPSQSVEDMPSPSMVPDDEEIAPPPLDDVESGGENQQEQNTDEVAPPPPPPQETPSSDPAEEDNKKDTGGDKIEGVLKNLLGF